MRTLVGINTYKVESIGAADDNAEADGVDVLTYHQALERVRELHRKHGAGDAPRGPYTVRQAIADYLVGHLEGKASENDTRKRLAAYVPAKLAGKEVDELGRDELVHGTAAWQRCRRGCGPSAGRRRRSTARSISPIPRSCGRAKSRPTGSSASSRPLSTTPFEHGKVAVRSRAVAQRGAVQGRRCGARPLSDGRREPSGSSTPRIAELRTAGAGGAR